MHTDYTKKTAIDLKTTFGDAFVRGKVTGIDFDSKKVEVTGDGDLQEVGYTHLVVATGSTAGAFSVRDGFTKAEQLEEMYRNVANEVSVSRLIYTR